MDYRVRHLTTYDYAGEVSISRHLLRLEPRLTPRQRVRSHDLRISPHPSHWTAETDYFGNRVHTVTIEQKHDRLEVETSAVVSVMNPESLDPERAPAWDEVREAAARPSDPTTLEASIFAFPSTDTFADPGMVAYIGKSFSQGRSVLEAAVEFNHRIFEDFTFDSIATDTTTPVAQAFAQKRGVCQDFAHVSVACLRGLGVPARYVSGYILTRPPEGQERMVGADSSHAWVSVWCGALGWVDMDPTNDMTVGTEHVTLAWGRDYTDVSPLVGVIYGSGSHSLNVAVDVEPLEDPDAGGGAHQKSAGQENPAPHRHAEEGYTPPNPS